MRSISIGLASILSMVFQFLSFSATSQKISEDHFENSEWNGTITYIYRTTSKHAGAYSEYVFKEHDNVSELRMAATITKGKGMASSSYTKQEKSIRREKVAGKEYEYEDNHSGTANGSKATELEIVFNEEDHTYSINVPTPGYAGTATRTYTCKGCGPDGSLAPKTYDLGGEESLIMVENQKLGDNPNILAGEIVDRSETENGEVTETITRWSFIRGNVDVELIVRLENYASWLPIPGKDENTAGDKIQVQLQLQGKDGKEPRLKAKVFELRLVNTSREPGLSINYPLVPAPAKPDLQFLKQEGAEVESEGQQMRITATNGKTGAATIGSFDGGGYTILEVEAILEGGLRVKGHLEVPKGATEIEVPKRKSGTKIAQAWLDKNGAPAEMDDKETSTGTKNNGDGLTAYEEYRGVFSEGKHLRLDPTKKELGVKIKRADIAVFTEGIAWFTAASGIEVIKLWEQELGEARIFNKNSLSAKAGVQHALQLLNETLEGGVPSENQPIDKWPKTPRESMRTVVDVEQIKTFYDAQKESYRKEGVETPYTKEEEIASTTAHELMHGVNVKHHGKNSDAVDRVVESYTVDKYLAYASNGSQIQFGAGDYKFPYKFKGKIGNEGCESSGDLLCIMAYTSKYTWCYRLGEDRKLIYLGVPPLPLGKHLCTSPAGTGINATGFFGNATWGNCLSQLKVKDY